MARFFKGGPVLAFVLAFIACPIPDSVTRIVYGFAAVVLYALLTPVLVLALPALRTGRASLWVILGLPCVLAVTVHLYVLLTARPGGG